MYPGRAWREEGGHEGGVADGRGAGIAVAIHTCASVCARKIFPGIQKFRETFAKVGCRSAKV